MTVVSNYSNSALLKDIISLQGAQTMWGGTSTSSSGVYSVTPNPVPVSLTAPMVVRFIANTASVGGDQLNLAGLGAKPMTKNGSTALAQGDITAGMLVIAAFDGTNFQIDSAALATPSAGSVTAASFAVNPNNANGVVMTDSQNRLPALDGSQLVNLTSGTDQIARAQIAVTNLRLMLSTSLSTGYLLQGRQWELLSDEWATGSSSYVYDSTNHRYGMTPATTKTVFTYTGSDQTFTVPAGVTSLTVKLWGANGANDQTYPAGTTAGGGYTTGTMAVTPSQALTIIVGGVGVAGQVASYGGGGKGNSSGGGGGGMAAIKNGSTYLAVAGGAGGTGYTNVGGVGGGTTGGNGQGTGGTQSSAGTGGTGQGQGQGANSYGGGGGSCGGGGGGYYGGGAGTSSNSGGGGSGYVGSMTSASTTAGNQTATASQAQANYSDSDFAYNSGHGRIVISYASTPTTATLVSPAVSLSTAPTYADLYFMYLDGSGSAVAGTDYIVKMSRDGGTTLVNATLTTLTDLGSAGFDGTYSIVQARANFSSAPTGTSLKAQVQLLNKTQYLGPSGLYAE